MVHNERRLLLNFTQRLQDTFFQNNQANMNNLSDHRLYKLLSPDRGMQGYLIKIQEKHIREAISRLRLGSHSFMVERGWWQRPKVDFLARLCEECGDIEDEYHMILTCPRFIKHRKKYLPLRLYNKPSMFSLINFLNEMEGKDLRMFGLFCYNILKEYNSKFI